MPNIVARRVAEFVPPRTGTVIAILGAAYKANVDDTRESPTTRLEELLHEQGYGTHIFDPIATNYERPLFESLADACAGAHGLVLMVDHEIFRSIDPAVVGSYMESRFLIDTKAFYDERHWEAAGFIVYTLGGKRRYTAAEAMNRRQGDRRIATALAANVQLASADEAATV
jgi:UDP-N-acetyl-D-mannosaminuronate dehydrogenase